MKSKIGFDVVYLLVWQVVQDSDDLFLADPLPQRPPGGDTTARHVHLDNTIQSEMADHTALYDEEELDNMAREQYEPVSINISIYKG